MKPLSLKARLWVLTLVSMLSLCALALFSLHELHQTLMADRQTKLRHMVEATLGVLRHYEARQRSGELTEKAARYKAAEAVRGMRYDQTEYFWINDLASPVPRMVMHPTIPELEGNVLDNPAYNNAVRRISVADGSETPLDHQNLFVAFARVIAESGHGYVEYEWPKPLPDGRLSSSLQTKLSYVSHFAPWGWVVGTGIYIDDVDAAYRKHAGMLVAGTLAVLVLLVLVAALIRRGLIRELGAEPADSARHTRELEHDVAVANAANRAKSAFLANVSHEIRTPMNSVIGMAELALRSGLDFRQRDYVEKIVQAGQHLLGIIDDILDYSKIEAGEMPLEQCDFTARQLADKLHLLFDQKARAKGLGLTIRIEPAVDLPLRGDPLRLGQILINLVANAVKFTERGEVRVNIGGESTGNGNWRLYCEVSDQGIGLSEAQIGKLFTSFQQADASTTRKYGGTGLGLAISRQLASLMGGEIGVRSVPGEGSTFWFTADVSSGKLTSTDPTAALLPPGALKSGTTPHAGDGRDTLPGVRVLLAEDNTFNQQVASELLIYAGALVSLANNGREAIDWLRRQAFDVVLMDLQMPEMDGLTATRLIRADPALRHTMIVAMTANATDEDRRRCLGAGMNDFVSKPFQPDQLFAVLSHLIAAEKAALPFATAPGQGSPAPADRTAPGNRAIDPNVLAATVRHDPEKFHRFAMLFLHSTQEALDQAKALLADAEMAQLCALGHRIKSSARAVGAHHFGELCQQMENMKRQDDLPAASALLDDMNAEFRQIEIEFANSISRQAAGSTEPPA